MLHSDFMRWLLDLDVIPAGAEGVRWAWSHPWPAWLWALLLVGAALFAAQSYRRLVGARTGRGALAATRTIVIVLLLIIISGPMLELPRETVERDWVIVLADRSASLTITDAEGPDGRASRDDQLRALLETHAPMWKALAEQRHLVWMGFHAAAFDLAGADAAESADAGPGEAVPFVELGDPKGQATNIGTAVEQVMQRAAK